MPATRRSARTGGDSSPPSTETTTAGTKRKAGDAASPKSKRPAKEQKTLEETISASEEKTENGTAAEKEQNGTAPEEKQENGAAPEEKQENGAATEEKEQNGDTEMKDSEPVQNGETKAAESKAEQNGIDGDEKAQTDDKKEETNGEDKSAFDEVKADERETGKTSKPEEDKPDTTNGDSKGTAVEEDKSREKAQPSNVLEKGVIYFFTRGRVGMDDPNSVTELQRSFFVLRPLSPGAKLTDGPIQDVGNNRLIALPKKVWPKSGRDRFMAFVEKPKSSMESLKETFFQGSDYSTKTTGTRHTPEVTPIGEGVYALTSTGEGRTTTHLAYMLSIPQELGEVQKDVGLAEKGSFVLSTKNPESSSPSYAQLPSTAEYPKDIQEEFGGRGWLPTRPEHLDYENASLLLIGEDFDSGKPLEPTAQDEKKDDKEVPEEELIKLEEEDEERIKNLKGDNSIFEDLGISSKDYPKVKSTW